MTHLDDFDRSLAAFLADGPSRAPEPPVIAAQAHARTTPRRWDPFAALRRDAMAAPARFAGLRPGYVLAAAALAAVAIGIAVVGAQRQEPPQPSLSSAPSAPPSSSPGAPAESAAAFSRDVRMLVVAGQPLVVRVTDATGDLVDATSLQPGDGASVAIGSVLIEADPADPNALVVRWSGPPCDERLAALVDESTDRITITTPTCSGDSTAFDRILRLAFASPVSAGAWFGSIATDQPSAPPGAPAASVDLGVVGGRTVTADIVDRSGDLTGVDVVRGDRQTNVDVPTVTNVDPQTLLVAWPGSPCDTVHRITIAADFGISIDRPICFGDAMRELWAVRLTFGIPVDANRVDIGLESGRRDSGLPAFAGIGVDSAGSPFEFVAFDDSARVSEIDGSMPSPAPPDPGAASVYALERVSDSTGRLVWRAPACATETTLRIDATANAWTLGWKACPEPEPIVVRELEVTLDHLPDTTGISVEVVGPQP